MSENDTFTPEGAQDKESATSLATITQLAHELGDEIAGQAVVGYAGETLIGENNIYKLVESQLADKTASLTSLVKPSLGSLVPEVVERRQLDNGRNVVVQQRIEGHHPDSLDDQLMTEILAFVDELQQVQAPQAVTDFEGTEKPADEYWLDLSASAQKYADRILSDTELSAESAQLVEWALEEIQRITDSDRPTPPLVITHKDIHEANLLIDDNGRLAGVLDWDAAQTGPRELEYAVLWQRFPGSWPIIAESLKDKPLDRDTFVAAGLTQILRFWKSFPNQADFVQKQIDAMSRTLDLAQGESIDGLTAVQ